MAAFKGDGGWQGWIQPCTAVLYNTYLLSSIRVSSGHTAAPATPLGRLQSWRAATLSSTATVVAAYLHVRHNRLLPFSQSPFFFHKIVAKSQSKRIGRRAASGIVAGKTVVNGIRAVLWEL